jgi:beta-glucanase (GH16 family)
MKKVKIILCCLVFYSAAYGQGPPLNWDLTYSDEFNGTKKSEWRDLDHLTFHRKWGTSLFSSSATYNTFGTEGARSYLELNAHVTTYMGNEQNFTGGVGITGGTNPNNNFYYGYYEIEAKVVLGSNNTDSLNSELWPTFWFIQGGEDDPSPGLFWYEEVDIFEPGPCSVGNNENLVHLWTNDVNTIAIDLNNDINVWKGTNDEYKGSTYSYMFDWHTYGVEWLPDRLTFYQDGIPFHTITERVPSHEKPYLWIDLQTSDNCGNLRPTGTHLGSYLINYFRYYELPTCNGDITEVVGDNYDFTGWSNAFNNVKGYCIFKNKTLSSTENIIVRHNDYVELKDDFIVPVGAELLIEPKPCQ